MRRGSELLCGQVLWLSLSDAAAAEDPASPSPRPPFRSTSMHALSIHSPPPPTRPLPSGEEKSCHPLHARVARSYSHFPALSRVPTNGEGPGSSSDRQVGRRGRRSSPPSLPYSQLLQSRELALAPLDLLAQGKKGGGEKRWFGTRFRKKRGRKKDIAARRACMESCKRGGGGISYKEEPRLIFVGLAP